MHLGVEQIRRVNVAHVANARQDHQLRPWNLRMETLGHGQWRAGSALP